MPDYSDIFDILKQDEEESKDENDSNDIFDILKEGDKKEPENTDLEPDNVSLDLPKITEEDIKVTEGEAVKRLKTRLNGLGFDFQDAIAGGDYVKVLAPADANGVREEKTFSVDKGVLGGDIVFGRMFGMSSIKDEAASMNKFIQDNYKKGEVEKGVSAEVYSTAMKNIDKQEISIKNEDGSIKKMKDQAQSFHNALQDSKIYDNVLKDVQGKLEAYTTEQTNLMIEKHDINTTQGREEANKELNRLIRRKNEQLITASPEYQKVIKSVNAAVVSSWRWCWALSSNERLN